jgi:hypothetical protein
MYALLIHERKLNLIAFFNTFFIIPIKWNLQLKEGFKLLKRTQKDIYVISNLFLDLFTRLTWHHYTNNHIPIPYNHEIINVIKVQNNPLQSFFVRPSFWVPWLWICPNSILSNIIKQNVKLISKSMCSMMCYLPFKCWRFFMSWQNP